MIELVFIIDQLSFKVINSKPYRNGSKYQQHIKQALDLQLKTPLSLNELWIFQFSSQLSLYIIVGQRCIYGAIFTQFTSELEKMQCLKFLLLFEDILQIHNDLSYNNNTLKKQMKTLINEQNWYFELGNKVMSINLDQSDIEQSKKKRIDNYLQVQPINQSINGLTRSAEIGVKMGFKGRAINKLTQAQEKLEQVTDFQNTKIQRLQDRMEDPLNLKKRAASIGFFIIGGIFLIGGVYFLKYK